MIPGFLKKVMKNDENLLTFSAKCCIIKFVITLAVNIP